LKHGQKQIDKNADPGTFLRGGETLWISGFEGSGFAVGMIGGVIFHCN
jgi:hypothetical protein